MNTIENYKKLKNSLLENKNEKNTTKNREEFQLSLIELLNLTKFNSFLLPVFQRDEAWKIKDICKLGESILLESCIPQIILSGDQKSISTSNMSFYSTNGEMCSDIHYKSTEHENLLNELKLKGRFFVLDGQQRLTSIRKLLSKEEYYINLENLYKEKRTDLIVFKKNNLSKKEIKEKNLISFKDFLNKDKLSLFMDDFVEIKSLTISEEYLLKYVEIIFKKHFVLTSKKNTFLSFSVYNGYTLNEYIEIFENLNNSGKDLSIPDLIVNICAIEGVNILKIIENEILEQSKKDYSIKSLFKVKNNEVSNSRRVFNILLYAESVATSSEYNKLNLDATSSALLKKSKKDTKFWENSWQQYKKDIFNITKILYLKGMYPLDSGNQFHEYLTGILLGFLMKNEQNKSLLKNKLLLNVLGALNLKFSLAEKTMDKNQLSLTKDIMQAIFEISKLSTIDSEYETKTIDILQKSNILNYISLDFKKEDLFNIVYTNKNGSHILKVLESLKIFNLKPDLEIYENGFLDRENREIHHLNPKASSQNFPYLNSVLNIAIIDSDTNKELGDLSLQEQINHFKLRNIDKEKFLKNLCLPDLENYNDIDTFLDKRADLIFSYINQYLNPFSK